MNDESHMPCDAEAQWHIVRDHLHGKPVEKNIIIRACAKHLSWLADDGDRLTAPDEEGETCDYGTCEGQS